MSSLTPPTPQADDLQSSAPADGLAVGMPMVLDESTGGAEKRRRVVHIERLTKTQIVIDLRTTGFVPEERRFKRGGFMKEIGRSSSYWTPSLDMATPELVAEVRAEQAHAKAYAKMSTKSNAFFNTLSTDQLERIAAIIAEPKVVAGSPSSEDNQ